MRRRSSTRSAAFATGCSQPTTPCGSASVRAAEASRPGPLTGPDPRGLHPVILRTRTHSPPHRCCARLRTPPVRKIFGNSSQGLHDLQVWKGQSAPRRTGGAREQAHGKPNQNERLRSLNGRFVHVAYEHCSNEIIRPTQAAGPQPEPTAIMRGGHHECAGTGV